MISSCLNFGSLCFSKNLFMSLKLLNNNKYLREKENQLYRSSSRKFKKEGILPNSFYESRINLVSKSDKLEEKKLHMFINIREEILTNKCQQYTKRIIHDHMWFF